MSAIIFGNQSFRVYYLALLYFALATPELALIPYTIPFLELQSNPQHKHSAKTKVRLRQDTRGSHRCRESLKDSWYQVCRPGAIVKADMSKKYYYGIDWFEDGLHLIECDSDEEGEPLAEAMSDGGDEPSPSWEWAVPDPSEIFDRETQQFLLQQQQEQQEQDDSVTPIEANSYYYNYGDILSGNFSDDSPIIAWDHPLEFGYDGSYDPWDRLPENSQLVTANTYSWWWFPTLVERVESGHYYWDWYSPDDEDSEGDDHGYNPYEARYGTHWADYYDDFGYGSFGSDDLSDEDPIAPDVVIDEMLPNLANFPPSRDYFIYPRHPTDQWWPLS
ncbi:hypothetical protein F4774DRAFT_419250 [Daldinia eschscholtzii]|nr:hypothetical protein F4774DRAFT_419250 [Daldinia eschscholtzii]